MLCEVYVTFAVAVDRIDRVGQAESGEAVFVDRAIQEAEFILERIDKKRPVARVSRQRG